MVLDKEIKTQLAQYLNLLESDIVLQTDLGDDDNSRKVKEFLDEIAAMSDRISLESTHLKRQPSFGIAQKGQKILWMPVLLIYQEPTPFSQSALKNRRA